MLTARRTAERCRYSLQVGSAARRYFCPHGCDESTRDHGRTLKRKAERLAVRTTRISDGHHSAARHLQTWTARHAAVNVSGRGLPAVRAGSEDSTCQLSVSRHKQHNTRSGRSFSSCRAQRTWRSGRTRHILDTSKELENAVISWSILEFSRINNQQCLSPTAIEDLDHLSQSARPPFLPTTAPARNLAVGPWSCASSKAPSTSILPYQSSYTPPSPLPSATGTLGKMATSAFPPQLFLAYR